MSDQVAVHPGIREYIGVQAIGSDADSPCFGRCREQRTNAHEDRLAQLKAEFVLKVLKRNPSESERLEAGQCIEQNFTRDQQLDVLRALLKGDVMKAQEIAHTVLNSSSEHYADLEV